MKLKNIKILSKYSVEVEVNDSDDINIEVVSEQQKYKFYMNGIEKTFDLDTETEIIQHIEDNINQDELEWVIANEDFNMIYSKLSFEDICKGYHQDKEKMKTLIQSDLDLFIHYEKYEKCTLLKELLDKVEKI